VEAVLGIQRQYGIEKALGYLIGEKVYNLVDTLYAARKICRLIEEERKKPDYKPSHETVLKRHRHIGNFDETYEEKKESS